MESPLASLEATGRRDEALRERLAELHSDAYGWALALTGADRDEAEEVLQTAYLRALDGRARFAGRSTLKTWWFGVIRRVAQERRRRRRVRSLAWLRWAGGVVEDPPEPGPADDLDRSRLAERLRRALAELSPRQRGVLHLVFYGDLTIAEAGCVLGISAGSARTHYERGKHRLRALLAEEEG
jgi:RNA polymerase sigma-70 factor (ECF subfamily)